MKYKQTHKVEKAMFRSANGEWKQLSGITEFTIEREIPDKVLPKTFNPCPKLEATIHMSKSEAQRLLKMIFGYREFTASQCVAIAERIAFGAWAVRCAERLVRE